MERVSSISVFCRTRK